MKTCIIAVIVGKKWGLSTARLCEGTKCPKQSPSLKVVAIITIFAFLLTQCGIAPALADGIYKGMEGRNLRNPQGEASGLTIPQVISDMLGSEKQAAVPPQVATPPAGAEEINGVENLLSHINDFLSDLKESGTIAIKAPLVRNMPEGPRNAMARDLSKTSGVEGVVVTTEGYEFRLRPSDDIAKKNLTVFMTNFLKESPSDKFKVTTTEGHLHIIPASPVYGEGKALWGEDWGYVDSSVQGTKAYTAAAAVEKGPAKRSDMNGNSGPLRIGLDGEFYGDNTPISTVPGAAAAVGAGAKDDAKGKSATLADLVNIRSQLSELTEKLEKAAFTTEDVDRLVKLANVSDRGLENNKYIQLLQRVTTHAGVESVVQKYAQDQLRKTGAAAVEEGPRKRGDMNGNSGPLRIGLDGEFHGDNIPISTVPGAAAAKDIEKIASKYVADVSGDSLSVGNAVYNEVNKTWVLNVYSTSSLIPEDFVLGQVVLDVDGKLVSATPRSQLIAKTKTISAAARAFNFSQKIAGIAHAIKIHAAHLKFNNAVRIAKARRGFDERMARMARIVYQSRGGELLSAQKTYAETMANIAEHYDAAYREAEGMRDMAVEQADMRHNRRVLSARIRCDDKMSRLIAPQTAGAPSALTLLEEADRAAMQTGTFAEDTDLGNKASVLEQLISPFNVEVYEVKKDSAIWVYSPVSVLGDNDNPGLGLIAARRMQENPDTTFAIVIKGKEKDSLSLKLLGMPEKNIIMAVDIPDALDQVAQRVVEQKINLVMTEWERDKLNGNSLREGLTTILLDLQQLRTQLLTISGQMGINIADSAKVYTILEAAHHALGGSV